MPWESFKLDWGGKTAKNSDFPPINHYISIPQYAGRLKEWQDIWDACQGNKLYAIYPNVGGYQYKSSLSRRDAVLINRLCIGHTRLTHSYLLSGDQPVCSACQSPLSVEHFLIECVNFAAIHRSILVLLQ